MLQDLWLTASTSCTSTESIRDFITGCWPDGVVRDCWTELTGPQ
jgi:hypothetical protein